MLTVFKFLGMIFAFIGTLFILVGSVVCFFLDALAVLLFFLAFGLIFLICGGVMLFLRRRRMRCNRRLLDEGVRVNARFKHLHPDRRYCIGRRCPFVVVCEGPGPNGTGTRTYRSESIWFDPRDLLSENTVFSVYVDPQNPSLYCVDLVGVFGEDFLGSRYF